jgi:hypothetical protein
MRATVMCGAGAGAGAGDVRVEDVPDPVVRESADAVVRVLRSAAATCGPTSRCRPLGQGTRVKLPAGVDEALLPSLLTLSDVFCTGHHAAVKAGVSPRAAVTVIGAVRGGGVISRVGVPQ